MSENKQADINALGFASTAEEMKNNFQQVEELMQSFSDSNKAMNLDPFNLGEAYSQWLAAVAANPEDAVKSGMDFWQKSMQLSQQMLSNMHLKEGDERPDPVITEERGDRRFKHDDWNEKPVFDVIKQSYLMISEWMRNMVTDVEGLDEHTAKLSLIHI